MPRGPRGTSTEHRAPRRADRPLGARASRPLAPPACPRYADAALPIAAAPPDPGPCGRLAPTGPPEETAAGAAATRVRLLAAHGSAGVSPAFLRTAPGSRRSRACRARRRVVDDRLHAAEPTIADAARRDAAATWLRGDGKRGDGEPARSSFLAAVFLLSAPTVQDRVHESVTLYTARRGAQRAALGDLGSGLPGRPGGDPQSGMDVRDGPLSGRLLPGAEPIGGTGGADSSFVENSASPLGPLNPAVRWQRTTVRP
jgi:hypothetical protein